MTLHRGLVALVLMPSAVRGWTNDLVSGCVQARVADPSTFPGFAFENTHSNASYQCTAVQLDSFYDPASFACGQTQDATSIAGHACPDPNQTIQCFFTAGWGSVAGLCETCENTCSLDSATGAASCCGTACTTSPGPTGSAGTECSDNTWVNDSSLDCGNAFSDGCCDCYPDCASCLNDAPAPQLDHTFCDCRKGTATSPDWAPCWNSCLDCFGDNDAAANIAYLPEALVEAECLGQSSCFVGTAYNDDGTGTWSGCDSADDLTTCTRDYGTVDLVNAPKYKAIALCG